MKYISSSGDLRLIKLNLYELQIISSVVAKVCQSISEREFQTRLGYYLPEVINLLECLNQKIAESTSDHSSLSVEISRDNFYTIWQSFNEVCNGLRINNYENEIGINRSDLKRMFEEWKILFGSSLKDELK